MRLVAGAHLGPYEIVSPLGAGGMGEVYRARDTRLKRDIAIKVLPADVASSPAHLTRLEREAMTVAGLNHPNIVVLYSIEEDGDTRFLTMELVEGRTLAALVASAGLPVGQIVDLAIPLADALVAAHEKGVVHRDLKPANVMVTREGRVKVLDFGLAKLSHKASDLDVTQEVVEAEPITGASGIVGTVPYMAPEQLRGETADARSDLFSLGIMLYELASGRRPFGGQSPAGVGSAILQDTPPPLASLRTDLPADFERIIGRCLKKTPRERFQTALEVLNELRSLRRTLEHGGPHGARAASDRIASIAVLPFVNRSASPDDEYFSDGLADELLNVLAKIRGLRVTARTSAFQFKGKNEDLAVIGQKLKVATVLEGSVRKAGNRVRISVQLVKVSDGYQLWSESYDRTLEDILAVQDDIARSVVKELRTKLLGEEMGSQSSGETRAEVARAAKGRAGDPEAHRVFLLARHLIDRWTRDDTAKGIGYLQQALERDAGFALAWAELSRAYANLAGWGIAMELGRARMAAERALSLEPDLAEGHAMMGRIRILHDRDFRGAEASYARALELAPGNALALRGAGVLASARGQLEKAIELYRHALTQDPLSAASYQNLGLALDAADRFAEAEAEYRRAMELAPQRTSTRGMLSLALLAQGRVEEALGEAQREPDETFRLWGLAIVHHAMGDQAQSREALRELIEKHAEDSACQVAEVHAVRGEADAAFKWLEKGFEQRDPGLSEMKAIRLLRPLHDDARWGALLRRMGLEE